MSAQPGSGPVSSGGEAARTRALRWGLWGCTTILIALVALMVVVASVAYVDFGEPDSGVADRLAAAARMAGDGGTINLADAIEGSWDEAHLFAPGADAGAVEACLGFAWDKAALVADHLAADAPGAFVVVADGAVAVYGWTLAGIAFADWPCGLTPTHATFTVSLDEDALRLALLEPGD